MGDDDEQHITGCGGEKKIPIFIRWGNMGIQVDDDEDELGSKNR